MDERYAAGLFDGEGCIRISRFAKPNSVYVRYNIDASIGMTYRSVIELFHKEFGGLLYHKPFNPNYPTNRPQWTVTFGSQAAATFIRRLRPHLIVKAEEADVALQLQHHIDSNPYIPAGRGRLNPNRDAIFAFRHELFIKIRDLKKRRFD